MADTTRDLRISDIHGSVVKDSPDVYLVFRVGTEHVSTPVIKNADEVIRWTEPLDLKIGKKGHGSKADASDELVVRAFDKKPLLPDSLLGEAKVQLSTLGELGNSQVAGSGGGANVEVQLLGKKDKFGGAITFTLSSTEGMTVPGGETWGPQEVHDGKAAAGIGGGAAAGTAGTAAAGGHASERSTSSAGGTAGYVGDGATAYPAQAAGQDLHGEHLSDFEKGTAGSAAATAYGNRDKSWFNPAERQGATSASGTTGGGAADPTVGVPGAGGATAFPAQESHKPLGGERLSDFEQGGGAAAGSAAAAGSSVSRGGASTSDGQLHISNIGAKLMRDQDMLGHVTPYLVFEVGRDRAHTTKHKSFKAIEQLTWEGEELTLDLEHGADAELKVIAYNKKLVPVGDHTLGEAEAPLGQLPRGRQARLTLVDRSALGNRAGEVTFTLAGGGPGGSGAGDDPEITEDVRTMRMPGAEDEEGAAASGQGAAGQTAAGGAPGPAIEPLQ